MFLPPRNFRTGRLPKLDQLGASQQVGEAPNDDGRTPEPEPKPPRHQKVENSRSLAPSSIDRRLSRRGRWRRRISAAKGGALELPDSENMTG